MSIGVSYVIVIIAISNMHQAMSDDEVVCMHYALRLIGCYGISYYA